VAYGMKPGMAEKQRNFKELFQKFQSLNSQFIFIFRTPSDDFRKIENPQNNLFES
jgi:hypothetical protein